MGAMQAAQLRQGAGIAGSDKMAIDTEAAGEAHLGNVNSEGCVGLLIQLQVEPVAHHAALGLKITGFQNVGKRHVTMPGLTGEDGMVDESAGRGGISHREAAIAPQQQADEHDENPETPGNATAGSDTLWRCGE